MVEQLYSLDVIDVVSKEEEDELAFPGFNDVDIDADAASTSMENAKKRYRKRKPIKK